MDTKEVTGTIKEFEGKGEKTLGRIQDRVKTTADDLINQSRKSQEQFSERAQEAWEDAIDSVRRRPAAALGTALGVGALIGAVIALVASRDR
jgi:ElaB/YqjD/DUF883 family membrane-anchored ribosome-binding protein